MENTAAGAKSGKGNKRGALSAAREMLKLGLMLCPWHTLVYLALSIAQGPIAALTTRYFAGVIDAIILAITDGFTPELWAQLAIPAAFSLLGAIMSVITYKARNYIGALTDKALQLRITELSVKLPYFTYLSPEYQQESGAASTNVSYAVSSVTVFFCGVLSACSSIVSYAVMLARYGGALTAFLVTTAVFASAIVSYRVKKVNMKQTQEGIASSLRSGYFDSLYSGSLSACEMALFGTDRLIAKSFERYFTENTVINLKAREKTQKMQTALTAFKGLVTAGAIIYVLLTGNLTTAGALIAALTAVNAINASSGQIGSYVGNITGDLVLMGAFLGFEDKFKKLAQVAPLSDVDAAPVEEDGDTALSIEHARFSYDKTGEEVLRDITLKMKKGEHIAIVGENGAGKTTLIELVLGLFEAQGGTVRLFGGDPYARLQGGEDTGAFALFQQFGQYEALSAGENMTLGTCEFDPELAAKIDPFLASFDPELLASEEWEEQGRGFSGGEWQKIALARCAFAKNARLIVLDEPTAALDPMAESEVFNNAMRLFSDRAVILITHRLGAVRGADRIYVLRGGVFTESGTHDELMASNGYYAAMFNEQAEWYRA